MGAGSSKPEGSSRHVFASDTPVQFSQELVDSLQASSETDSTRNKSFDLHIAQRVKEELEKIQAREQSALESLYAKISSESSSSDTKSSKSSKPRLLDIAVSSIQSTNPFSDSSEEEQKKSLSSSKVLSAIEKLQKDLDARKHVKELPDDLEKTRSELVFCLRKNDRRPLDCWKEVESFKNAVGVLESKFVDGVL